MRGTFSTILQKYYFRSGHRLVFENGMSLTQMALEMWERLDFKEIDSSVISRVLTGNRLFTCKQLAVFADILVLSGVQRRELEEALMQDVMARYGFHPSRGAVDIVALLEKTLSRIETFRSMSHSDIVIEWTEDLHEYFRREIESIQQNPQALHLYVEFIKLRIRCALEARQSAAVQDFVTKLSDELFILGKSLHDESLINAGKVAQAALAYNSGDYPQAAPLLVEALKHKLETFDAIVMKRCLGISLVYIGKEPEYQVVKRELLTDIEGVSPHLKCEALEGLAKAEIGLGKLKKAEAFFKKAQDAIGNEKLEKTEYGIIREIQLVRTLLQGVLKDRGFLSINEIDRRGTKALEFAQIYGFKRHELQLNCLMNKLLL